MSVLRVLVISILISSFCSISVYAQNTADIVDTGIISVKSHKKVEAVNIYYDATRAKNKGDLDEATALLQKVLKLDPRAGGAWFDLARISMAKKDFKDAENYINKAIDIEPENYWYKEQYASLLLEQHKFKEAAKVYEEIVNSNEHNKEYLQRLALIYQRAGDTKAAINTIDKLLADYPDDEELLEEKLQIYLNDNQLDKAEEVNNILIRLIPNESSYYIRLAEMYNNNNQLDKAAEVYKKAEKQFQDDPGIQLSLSDYYKSKGNTEKYKEYVKKVITNNSLDEPTQLTVLSKFFTETNDSSDREFALELAAKIAEMNPESARSIAAYGDMLAITGKTSQAAEPYKNSLEIDPANYTVWKNLLSVYIQGQQWDSLIKYSDRALKLFPNQANLHYMKGVAHYSTKDYKPAVSAIERAIIMIPEENKGELAGMYAMLGDIYNSLKDYKSADENFDEALKIDPDNPTSLNNYAYYLSVRGERLDDAERMSKRSLELSPELPTFLDTYGWILYKRGDYKKAEEYIEKAIKLEEVAASGTLWDHLGDIQYKLGKKDKAYQSWLKAKELGTDNDDIDRKLKDKILYE